MLFRYINETDNYDCENVVTDNLLETMSAQFLTMVSTIYQLKMNPAIRLIVKGLAREQLKSMETTMRTAKSNGSIEAKKKAEEKGLAHLLENPLLCRPDKKEDPVMFLLTLLRPIILNQLRSKNIVVTAQNYAITSFTAQTENTSCQG